jgi:hypothetical protein
MDTPHLPYVSMQLCLILDASFVGIRSIHSCALLLCVPSHTVPLPRSASQLASPSHCIGPVTFLSRCHPSCRRQRSPYKLRVSCPAVEQDTEAPSTSGRPHSDSEWDGNASAGSLLTSVVLPARQCACSIGGLGAGRSLQRLLCASIRMFAVLADVKWCGLC